MRRVLVDTHVFLWLQTEPERLGAAIGILEDAATEVHLSAASSWELAVADLPLRHRDQFDRLLVAQSVVERMPIVTADAALTAYPVELIQVAEDRPGQ